MKMDYTEKIIDTLYNLKTWISSKIVHNDNMCERLCYLCVFFTPCFIITPILVLLVSAVVIGLGVWYIWLSICWFVRYIYEFGLITFLVHCLFNFANFIQYTLSFTISAVLLIYVVVGSAMFKYIKGTPPDWQVFLDDPPTGGKPPIAKKLRKKWEELHEPCSHPFEVEGDADPAPSTHPAFRPHPPPRIVDFSGHAIPEEESLATYHVNFPKNVANNTTLILLEQFIMYTEIQEKVTLKRKTMKTEKQKSINPPMLVPVIDSYRTKLGPNGIKILSTVTDCLNVGLVMLHPEQTEDVLQYPDVHLKNGIKFDVLFWNATVYDCEHNRREAQRLISYLQQSAEQNNT